MELLQAIHGRRSVREFTDEPVSEAVLHELIDAAIQAPSAINQQPWCFLVVRDQALLARISDHAKAHLLRASLGAPAHPFRDILNDPQFNIFYRAPVLVVKRNSRVAGRDERSSAWRRRGRPWVSR